MEMTLKPTLKQNDAFFALEDRNVNYVVFGGGAGGGKTWLGCEWLLTQCLSYPGIKCFIGRAELKRIMQSTFITFQEVSKHHGVSHLWKYKANYSYILFENGSRIDLLDLQNVPSDPNYERYGSIEYTLGFIEEGGEVHSMAFDVLKSRIGRFKNKQYDLIPKMLITCNPKKNWIYNDFYKPWKQGVLPDNMRFIQSLYKDNPHTADTYGEQLSSIKDIATRQRLMLGNWEYDDNENAMISYEAMTDLRTNVLALAVDDNGQQIKPIKFISVDVARKGKDKTKIVTWEGLNAVRVKVLEQEDTEVVSDTVKAVANTEQIPRSRIVIDEDGVGGGVLDQCKGARGFIANSSPTTSDDAKDHDGAEFKLNYVNFKAQCAYMLADLINDRMMACTFDQAEYELLVEELQVLRSLQQDEKKLGIIPKSDMKELLGRSPDIMDTFIMRMSFEVKKEKKAGLRVVRF